MGTSEKLSPQALGSPLAPCESPLLREDVFSVLTMQIVASLPLSAQVLIFFKTSMEPSVGPSQFPIVKDQLAI